MTNQPVEILILTRSIVLQQGLRALLDCLPTTTDVKAIQDLSNAYPWIQSHAPRIVLLDIALSGSDPRPVLEKIQSISTGTQRILLVDDVHEMTLIPQYAEAILVKGAAPSVVTIIVTNLLSSI
jgi:DNA-binding NarL/FixJ family response regulator